MIPLTVSHATIALLAVSLGLLALLILIALAVIAAGIYIWYLFSSAAQRRAALGTLPKGSTPSNASISERWTTAPTVVTVGTNTTFVFTVESAQVSGLLPVSGRIYAFDVQPSADISIVSVTPPNAGGTNWGNTNASGTITVVIVANSVPATDDPEETPIGVLVTQQVNASASAAKSTSFTVQ